MSDVERPPIKDGDYIDFLYNARERERGFLNMLIRSERERDLPTELYHRCARGLFYFFRVLYCCCIRVMVCSTAVALIRQHQSCAFVYEIL